MSTEAEELLAQLEQQGAELRAMAEEIATELRRGRDAEAVRVDVLRPRLMTGIGALNQTVLQCGLLPANPETRRLQAAINLYRPQAGYWMAVDRLLHQQLPPRARLFEGPRSTEPSLNSIQIETSDALMEVLHFVLQAQEQTEQAYAHGCHDDIPLKASTFASVAHAAHRVLLAQGRAKDARFLDIGCGNGMKLLAAAPYFEQCDGLEYQDTSVTAAEKLLKVTNAYRCRVFQGDAMTFEGYGDYEVLYLYKPMRDPAVLAALEDRIVAQAAPGTLLIAPYYGFVERYSALECGRITEHLFVTGTDQETADGLGEEAEYTGLGLPKDPPSAMQLWEPIIEASAERGFVLLPSGVDFVM